MNLSFVAHQQVLPLLEADLPTRVFPAYVCGSAPEGVSLAATAPDSRVLAAMVDGARFGLFEACGPWFFSCDDNAARRLLDEVAQTGIPHGLEFSPSLEPLVRARFPAAVLSQDVLLTLNGSPRTPSADPKEGALLQLVGGDPRWAQITPTLQRTLGTLDSFTTESPLWAWEMGGKIIALAETLVRFDRFACFGQVTTDVNYRKMGYAKRLVSAVSSYLCEQGFTPLWLAAATNEASLRLAAHVGFTECARYGCVDFGDVQEGMADIE